MLRLLSLLPLVLLGALPAAPAEAELRFVHLTDPHLFDDAKRGQDFRRDDRELLERIVAAIDEQVRDGLRYEFVVVTGDLGIEMLVSEKKKVATPQKLCGEDVTLGERRILPTADAELKTAAADLARIIAPSTVERWIFVPGNNDLVEERPASICYYRTFLESVRDALPKQAPRVIDLSPRKDDLASGILAVGGYTFLGFDNASFKSNNVASDSAAFREAQRESVRRVRQRLALAEPARAYVFFHIPQIDDPRTVATDGEGVFQTRYPDGQVLQRPYRYSAWFVDGGVREAWNELAARKEVKALFAGHFHEARRSVYRDFRWLATDRGLYPSLRKLYVAPPVAMKFQDQAEERARGFQTVRLDDAGDVERRFHWLVGSGAQRNFVVEIDPRRGRVAPAPLGLLGSWFLVLLPPALFALLAREHRARLKQRRSEIRARIDKVDRRLYDKAYPDDALDGESRVLVEFDQIYAAGRYVVPVGLLALVAALADVLLVSRAGLPLGLPPELTLLLDEVPKASIAAIGGAYIWGFYDLITRHYAVELSPSAFHAVWMRMLIVVVLGYFASPLLEDQAELLVAFGIGAFPLKTLHGFTLRQARERLGLSASPVPAEVPSLRWIQGLTPGMVERLAEDGIETTQQIANLNPFDLLLRTNASWHAALDLIDQAFLINYVGPKLGDIRAMGFRGAIEVASLHSELTDGNRAAKQAARAVLKDLAAKLEQSDVATRHLVDQVGGDYQVQLLWDLWSQGK